MKKDLTLDRVRHFVWSPAGRLAASYLLVIMVMSIGYSVVLYRTSASQLHRQLPSVMVQQYGEQLVLDGINARPTIRQYLEERANEGERALVARLILLNMFTLAVGGGLSYYLARRTLKPIEANMEAQAQFVSDASHELRTPLTTLQTSNEVALRDEKLTVAKSRELLQANVEEVSKLKNLTDGLLLLARGEVGTMATEAVMVQDVIAEVMNKYMAPAQTKGISIDDQVPGLRVIANRQALEQTIGVLVDNAIKYGPNDSVITLHAMKHGKRVIIRVIDQGPGIRPYDVRRIFDRFYRADQSRSRRHVPGTGIGLSLAKKLIEQQDGEITVTSTVGRGSTFSVTLPSA